MLKHAQACKNLIKRGPFLAQTEVEKEKEDLDGRAEDFFDLAAADG